MNLLIPQTTHTISFQKQNLLDTSTIFVQAVVKRALTGDVLDTINLTDVNGDSSYFRADYKVPPDASGSGTELIITRTVYTDSGYTSVSPVYGAWAETYLIRDIGNKYGGYAPGAQGGNIDYREIEKLIKKAISEIPRIKEVDLSEIITEIGGVKETVKDKLKNLFSLGLRVTEYEKQSRNVVKLVEEVRKEIKIQNSLIETISTKIAKDIGSKASVSIEDIKSVAKEMKEEMGAMESKSKEEREKFSKEFATLMEEKVGELSGKFKEQIEASFSKPLKIRTFQDLEVTREKEKEEEVKSPSPQERAKRLM